MEKYKRYLSKEDIANLELINNEVRDIELRNKLLEIYISSYRKEEDYVRRHQRLDVSLDAGTEESKKIESKISMLITNEDSITMDRFLIEELYKAIDQLTETEKLIIWLFFFCNKTSSDIGKELGMTQQAISKKKIKTLEKLRKVLKREEK